MEPETIALLGGLLFLLLALVGGGFTVKEISMPRIAGWARGACLLVGAALLVPFFIDLRPDPAAGVTGDSETPRPAAIAPPPGEAVVRSDPGPWVSPEAIEVTALTATAEASPLKVGGLVTIRFVLRNVGAGPVTFETTYVAARDPVDVWRDDGHENEGLTLEPGAALTVSHGFVPSRSGTWSFWPCYTIESGVECPDEWRKLLVTVR